jgi:hypothetical protein
VALLGFEEGARAERPRPATVPAEAREPVTSREPQGSFRVTHGTS